MLDVGVGLAGALALLALVVRMLRAQSDSSDPLRVSAQELARLRGLQEEE